MFFLPNSIKFVMDWPVEKMHVKELKEIPFGKKVSMKGVTVKAQHYDFSPCVLVIQGHEDRPPKRGIVVIHQKEKFVQDFVVRVLCSFCFH